MPRPSVPPSDRRRRSVNVRVADATWTWIRREAQDAHTTIGTWLRWFAFHQIPPPDLPEHLRQEEPPRD